MATIEQNLTQLVQDRDDLVSNLTTKGITGLTGDETFTELVPEVLNISSGGNISDYFENTISTPTNQSYPGLLYSIKKTPSFVVSGTSLNFAFYNCFGLQTISLIDTSNVIRMSYIFKNCSNLLSVPQLDTSNVQFFPGAFAGCSNLTTIPKLNAKSITDMTSSFSNCTSLTTLGGFENLGQAYLTDKSANYNAYTLSLSNSTLLTHDSLMNVINNLYDIATKGCNTQKLQLGSTNLAKLSSAEIAIATNKGWTVS